MAPLGRKNVGISESGVSEYFREIWIEFFPLFEFFREIWIEFFPLWIFHRELIFSFSLNISDIIELNFSLSLNFSEKIELNFSLSEFFRENWEFRVRISLRWRCWKSLYANLEKWGSQPIPLSHPRDPGVRITPRWTFWKIPLSHPGIQEWGSHPKLRDAGKSLYPNLERSRS